MSSLAKRLALLPPDQQKALLAGMCESDVHELLYSWRFRARSAQLPPDGDWRIWLILSGRGFGKTRTGAEWVRSIACGPTPLSPGQCHRIAIVGETAADCRDVLAQGDSGVLAVHPKDFRPIYRPSTRSLTWPNGAQAFFYNGTEPDQLRGPQHDAALIDELCFVAGTLIAGINGSAKPIEYLQEGDLVLTRQGYRRVLHAGQTSQSTSVAKITLQDGRFIVATLNHPIFVHGQGFTPVQNVNIRDELWCIELPTGVVANIEHLSEPQTVYNLEVEGAHEYFANGILVHNCKYRYAKDCWDQLQFGLRLGEHPQQVITTTPRPIPLIRDLIAESYEPDSGVVLTRGSTFDNRANLAPSFLAAVEQRYAGSRLGRQELDGELLDDVPGALWSRQMLDAHRKRLDDKHPPFRRIIVAIDPAAKASSDSDTSSETGIIVAGLGDDGRGYLIDDRSCRLGPNGWAAVACSNYDFYEADAIVAEINQGGDMVESVIKAVNPRIKVIKVRATRGKTLRAEPISALYAQGRISHIGSFPALEDQMMQFTPFGIEGDGAADRVDALVWAFTELFPSLIGKIEQKPRQATGFVGSHNRSSVTGY
jgi:phage terminase large subunit-like protein